MDRSYKSVFSKENVEEYFLEERFQNRYRSFEHPSYDLENNLRAAIRRANEEEALALLEIINSGERANLSSDPLRSFKNSIICSCTIFTRAAIDGGLDSESAFMLSDLFIRQIERVPGIPEAEDLEKEMLLVFIEEVKKSAKLAKVDKVTPIIGRTRNYIRQNITKKLSLKTLADNVRVHPNYLANQFKKEYGHSVMNYYDQVRLDAIKQYLIHTDMPLSEIATLFEFSSFSHFSTYFKKQTGVSPRGFRKQVPANGS